MDETKYLIGERVGERTLTVAGPERKLDDLYQRLIEIPGINVVLRQPGDTPDNVGSVTFLFGREAKQLLTLLPLVGTKYILGNQEVK